MTSLRNRLSRASCDSPSLKLTVANTLTSFPPKIEIGKLLNQAQKTGSLAHNALGGSRIHTTLAVDFSPDA